MLSVTFIILPVILAIAFVTLSDRKGIGILQRRLGPDTVGALGILQPFADALKLLIKEELQPSNSLPALGVTLPCLVLMCGLLGFTFIPVAGCQAELDVFFQILANMALLSLAVHGILYIAWEGENNYSFIGALRTTSQLISYELTLSAAFLAVALFHQTLNYSSIHEMLGGYFTFASVSLVLPLFMIAALAESGRIPFDLPEAESEIVAGFITELSAVPFVLYFLGEYTSLFLLITLTSLMFLPRLFSVSLILVLSVAIWARATLPRLRYDQLIHLGWLVMLPNSTLGVMVYLVLQG